MSDAMSMDSGPDSEFEYEDLNKKEEQKSVRKRFGQLSGRRPAANLIA